MIKVFCDSCSREMDDSVNIGKDAGRIIVNVKGRNGLTVKCIESTVKPLGNEAEGDVCKWCVLDAFLKMGPPIESLCKIYFDIACEAIGEKLVRERRDKAILNSI